MKITKQQIEALSPCQEGFDWYLQNGSEDLLETLLKVNETRPDWARWLFTNLMTKKQNIEIAIFSAKLVLPIFEKKFPNDKRPRLAIEAAKNYLITNDSVSSTTAYASDAADAAVAAAFADVTNTGAANNKKEIEKLIIKVAVTILERDSK